MGATRPIGLTATLVLAARVLWPGGPEPREVDDPWRPAYHFYPAPSSRGVALEAEGGQPRLVNLTAWPMAHVTTAW